RLFRPLLHFLVEEMRRAEERDDDLGADVDRSLVAFGAAARGLAAERAYFAFEVPDARLACVPADDEPQRSVSDGQLLRGQSMVRDLLLHEMIAGDRELLFFGVSGNLEHLHAVAQR